MKFEMATCSKYQNQCMAYIIAHIDSNLMDFAKTTTTQERKERLI